MNGLLDFANLFRPGSKIHEDCFRLIVYRTSAKCGESLLNTVAPRIKTQSVTHQK